MAADIRIPGRDLALLRKTAVSMRMDGVGYYPASGFVHVDVGRIRPWSLVRTFGFIFADASE